MTAGGCREVRGAERPSCRNEWSGGREGKRKVSLAAMSWNKKEIQAIAYNRFQACLWPRLRSLLLMDSLGRHCSLACAGVWANLICFRDTSWTPVRLLCSHHLELVTVFVPVDYLSKS